jgi:hypothetical protein
VQFTPKDSAIHSAWVATRMARFGPEENDENNEENKAPSQHPGNGEYVELCQETFR